MKIKIFPVKSLNKIATQDLTFQQTPDPQPKSTIFDTPKPTKEPNKRSQFNLQQNVMNKNVIDK